MGQSVIFIIVGVVSFSFGILAGYIIRRRFEAIAKKEAEKEAEKIILDAKKESESLKEKLELEAKERLHRERIELERENKRYQANLSRQEERIKRREQEIDKRQDIVRRQEERLKREEEILRKKQDELFALKKEEMAKLEAIANMNIDEVKRMLINEVEQEARYEASKTIKKVEEGAQEIANKRAMEIIASAITRCASDYVSESTISVVPLPSEEIKGRIIGREGRNVRAFEMAVGVELIVDDTPEVVTISGYDPIRREIGRIALEKLIQDGRIHPGRIEEIVSKVESEIEATMKEEAKQAALDLGIHNLTPREIELLGRLKFRTSYGQNVLQHSIEVTHLASVMASELGIKDLRLVKKAAFLHDIGKALDSTVEGSHVEIAEEVLKQAGEDPILINAVIAHHEGAEPKSIEAILVQAADAISASRPGARKDTVEAYIKRLEKLESIATGFPGVEKAYAIQAGREIRVIVNSQEVDDVKTFSLAKDIADKIKDGLEYPGPVKVNVIREIRAIEYAK
ncbi:TPA: ribonuclease Y [bacterium]|nr:ribonuclease Y [bacterium]